MVMDYTIIITQIYSLNCPVIIEEEEGVDSEIRDFWLSAERVLGKDTYRMLYLHYHCGYRLREIGAKFGLSVSGVSRRLKAAREKLRRVLNGRVGGSS